MKRSKKITMVLVTAMVMTVAMVVLVYAAEVINKPAWSTTTGRYTQVYEMYTSPNWRYTNDIDTSYDYSVVKTYSDRDCLVQCTSNGLTAFPTYYVVYSTGLDIFRVTSEATLTGTGTATIDVLYASCDGYPMKLGIRNDPRYSTTVTNKGSWSPDTY